MIRPLTLLIVGSLLASSINIANGAFIIEPNGLASTNYSAANPTSTSTTAGSGTLAAPGLTLGAASVFGGEPYIYTYTPAVDGDNATFIAGDPLNGFAGHTATGDAAGGVGLYNVYLTYPESTNNSVANMPALYDIDVDGDSIVDVSASYDQNVADAGTGMGIGLWELVGQINVTDANQAVTLTISPSNPPGGFVGVRTAGVLFDAVVVPEPGYLMLLACAAAGLGLMRRR